MNILIDKVRIKNFRSLFEVEVDLQPLTLLVGTNNAGKTSFLRALNTVLGTSRSALNRDDLFINASGAVVSESITIDIRIIPFIDGERKPFFDDADYGLFGGAENVQSEVKDGVDMQFYAFRATYTFTTDDTPIAEYKVINIWEDEAVSNAVVVPIATIREHLVLYFIDAQRDISDDLKLRTSYFGKQTAEVRENAELKKLETSINTINTEIVKNSPVLNNLSVELENLNTSQNSKINIKPLPSRIRDLHKGMRVEYKDGDGDAFSMEYHGMGTRSWASMLSFGAYTNWETKKRANYYAVLALEEPEAHLHPNAQRALYGQLTKFKGQKIVSTHSPYIVAQAELEEIRHFYKTNVGTKISQLHFQNQDELKEITKLKTELSLGLLTPDEKKEKGLKIKKLNENQVDKINIDDKERIRRQIMYDKGELFFTKGIVLFEGITEGLALPIFAHHYFDNNYPYQLGLNFIDVGGKKSYIPFLIFAKFLQIPVFILSDGDGDTEKQVKNQIKEVFENEATIHLFVLDNLDFEEYLIKNNFENEIMSAIDGIESTTDYINSAYIPILNLREKSKGVIRNYIIDGIKQTKTALLDCMKENKTQYAEVIANACVSSIKNNTKPLPPALQTLFERIATTIHYTKKQ